MDNLRIWWRAPLSRGERAAALAMAAGAIIIGLLSFVIWQAWWLSTLWLTASPCAASVGGDTASQAAAREQVQ